MSNKLTLEGLSAFKTKIDDKFSLKGHTHSNYATKEELALVNIAMSNGDIDNAILLAEQQNQ